MKTWLTVDQWAISGVGVTIAVFIIYWWLSQPAPVELKRAEGFFSEMTCDLEFAYGVVGDKRSDRPTGVVLRCKAKQKGDR